MKKVFLVLESWGKGGTETYVSGLARYLLDQGVDVTLILLSSAREDLIDFLPVNKVKVLSVASLFWLVKRSKPDVISLHLYTRLLPAVLLSRLAGCDVVSTLHMPLKSWGTRHQLYWRAAIYFSHKVVGVSRLITSQLALRNILDQPLPGGIDQCFFSCKRSGKLRSQEEFSIVAIGRLSNEKDWSTLIKAVAELKNKINKNVTIEFCGDGPLLHFLEEECKEFDVKANFHGFLGKKDLLEVLAYSDISVLPSKFEGLGLSALESMAAGVPTFTSDFKASEEFIHKGVTGDSFPVSDHKSLSNLILKYMDDPDALRIIGKNGKDFAEKNFSEKTAYIKYLKVFGFI